MICPICEQTFSIAATETKRLYCSAACTEQAALQLECWQYVITLRPLLPAEFLALLQQRSLRDYARQMVWRQGEQEFMVCEDYTLANIYSAQITLAAEHAIEFVPVPSAAWQAVMWEYDIICLSATNCVFEKTVAKVSHSGLLHLLARSPENKVRCLIAQNLHTSAETLEYLAYDEDELIRRAVAYHPQTPPDILAEFATDEDVYTRRGVATNPNTDWETLVLLAEDAQQGLRRIARRRLEQP